MTIVEFFDRNSIENILSAIICSPCKVIMLGSDEEELIIAKNNYSLVASERKLSVNFEYRVMKENSLEEITRKLREIALTEPDLIFDLTGGDDLYLVSVGIIYSEYPEKVKLHRFNIEAGILIDSDADGKILSEQTCEITVKENIRIYGGDIIEKTEGSFSLDELRNNKQFKEEVETLWGIASLNADSWNENVKNLAVYNSRFKTINSLNVRIVISEAEDINGSGRNKLSKLRKFLRTLAEKRLIYNYNTNPFEIFFTFRSERIRRFLISEGLVLEAYVGSVIAQIKDSNGNYLYNDVRTGVNIDWDGEIIYGAPNVKNEIDVVAIKGVVPVFVSCKNGTVDNEEPYKLVTVARRFGGEYAKTALVVSALKKVDTLKKRAEEMEITLLPNAERMKKSTLVKIFSSI